MYHYQFHIGDYMAATAHLSALEDCYYRRLLDLYYTKEAPVPLDLKYTYRLVRAASKAERDAVDIVLSEFFEETQEGYVQARCEREIAKTTKGAGQREENKASEQERLRRHRDRRKKMCADLRDAGISVAWDVSTDDLTRLHERHCIGKPATPETPPATFQVPETATPETVPRTPPDTAIHNPRPETRNPIPDNQEDNPDGVGALRSARAQQQAPPVRKPISPGWQPSETDLAFVAMNTIPPWTEQEIAENARYFVDSNTAGGYIRADWSAEWRIFVSKRKSREIRQSRAPVASKTTGANEPGELRNTMARAASRALADGAG